MNIKNLTPDPQIVLFPDGTEEFIEPSGWVAKNGGYERAGMYTELPPKWEHRYELDIVYIVPESEYERICKKWEHSGQGCFFISA